MHGRVDRDSQVARKSTDRLKRISNLLCPPVINLRAEVVEELVQVEETDVKLGDSARYLVAILGEVDVSVVRTLDR